MKYLDETGKTLVAQEDEAQVDDTERMAREISGN